MHIMTDKDYDKARKALGDMLFSARESLSLTQTEVASRADIHVNYYARMERGIANPSFEKLQSVMRVLKLKTIDLY